MSEPSANSSAFWMPAAALRKGGKKVRPEAVLKNLLPPAQALIAEWATKPVERDETGKPIAGTGGIPFALAKLADIAEAASRPELAVGQSTLYAFLEWLDLERDLEISEEREQQVLAKTGDRKKAREAGEVLLARLGLAKQNPKLIQVAAQISDNRRSLDLLEESGKTKARQKDAQIKQKDADLRLAERRVVLLEKKVNEAKKTLGDGTLTPEQRQAKMKQIFGVQ